ncbi:MAG: PorT family protein [Bacteroidaceae bacterium]|nr:PorT family protein [Bacteroidaceae bacterium]
MNKVRGLILMLTIITPPVCGARSSISVIPGRVNFGIAAGCASTSLYMREISIGDFTTSNYSRSPEVCYLFDAFARININRCYLQTGVSYYNNVSSVSFDVPKDINANSREGMITRTLSVSGQNLQIPAIFGFYIIRQAPYYMSLFAGPELSIPLKSTYRSDYSGFGSAGTIDDLYPVNWKMTLGICFNISCVFLNFGYDFDLRAQSDGTIRPNVPLPDVSEVVMRRTSGMLHFSVGLMF